MPLRRSSVPRGLDVRLYRRIQRGGPATSHLFDTRQHRSDQFCGGLPGPCGRESDPTRTLTGEDRQSWPGGARSSPARWEQVLMAQNDSAAGPLEMDDRDARAASRDRITRGWTNAGVRNPPCSPLTPTSTTPAISSSTTTIRTHRSPVPEPVTTPVTSGGVSAGEDSAGGPENPHSRFHDDMRGYVRTKISSGEPRADLSVPHVPERNSPAETEASSVISDRARVRKR